jgi:hypothetical protein
MSLQVYGQGKTGEIFIEDERPDGTVVLLVCAEGATRSPAASRQVQPEIDGEPVGMATSSAPDGTVFPLFREHGIARKRFKLHVDTTDMEGGILKFAMAPFTRASLRAADEGKREVRLDTSNAEDWGYLGPLAANPAPIEPYDEPYDEPYEGDGSDVQESPAVQESKASARRRKVDT